MSPEAAVAASLRNPFRGLRPFEADEADLFFGRKVETGAVVERLHRHRFLAVVGASGCGKSSLVRAGAIASLRVGATADEPNWRIALTLITLGQETPDSRSSRARDSLYAEAERRARTAVKTDTTRADGWFVLANAMGRTALTRPPQQRLKLARAIRTAAIRAILLDPSHDGAYHVLGRWHAEIMRLPGIERFFARRVLGARIFDEASWDEATVNLERAVALDTTRIVHRLDLAEIYADQKRYAEARAQLDTVATMPEREYLDPRHKEAAAALLSKIAEKTKP